MVLLKKTKEIKDFTKKNKSESQQTDKKKQTDTNQEQINNEKNGVTQHSDKNIIMYIKKLEWN